MADMDFQKAQDQAAQVRQAGGIPATVYVLKEPDGLRVKIRGGSEVVGQLVEAVSKSVGSACQNLGIQVKSN